MSKKTIVFTGGGTAGHVTPNLALIESYAPDEVNVCYIGSIHGIEKKLVKAMGIPFYAIHTGKFRRELTWKHLTEPFKLIYGMWEAYRLLGQLKPDLVFSKGGFVALPVVWMASLRKIPVVAHESDMTPGLANRLCMPFVKKLCANFPQLLTHVKAPERLVVTGTPIRQMMIKGQAVQGRLLSGLQQDKPIILVMGGSSGSVIINKIIRQALPKLLESFQLIHITGQGHLDEKLLGTTGYFQIEYAHLEMGDLLAASDMVISRSGANSLCELLTLAKPHLLIPLSKKASRGDQITNAAYFEKQGVSLVLAQEDLNMTSLIEKVAELSARRFELANKIKDLGFESSTQRVKMVMAEVMANHPNLLINDLPQQP